MAESPAQRTLTRYLPRFFAFSWSEAARVGLARRSDPRPGPADALLEPEARAPSTESQDPIDHLAAHQPPALERARRHDLRRPGSPGAARRRARRASCPRVQLDATLEPFDHVRVVQEASSALEADQPRAGLPCPAGRRGRLRERASPGVAGVAHLVVAEDRSRAPRVPDHVWDGQAAALVARPARVLNVGVRDRVRLARALVEADGPVEGCLPAFSGWPICS